MGTFLLPGRRIQAGPSSVVSRADGAGALSQQFEDAGERLTEEEVQAIVKRYGERQSGGDARSTVADVAEALQVDPSVVTRILRDVRTAESEKQIQERLSALERENAELRKRAEDAEFGEFYPMSHWAYRRRTRRRKPQAIAALMAVMVAFGVMMQVRGAGVTPFPFIAMVFVMAGVFWAVRSMRR